MLTFFINLLIGTGILLIGVELLTKNIEQLATSKIKDLFSKTANNKILNVAIGAATTALIQSSGVTTVLIVGFVNAGIMNLYQATAMIMGANIGTTITAQIAALSTFEFTTYIKVLTFVGIFMSMLTKKESTQKIGKIMAGLGCVFVGLSLMSASISSYKDNIQVVFSTINNPFLLFLIGIALTALVQSSSIVTSVLIAMLIAGLTIGKGGNEILYIILGSNIGSCVTALISSIGTGKNAKRTSLIHFMFNTFGALLFFAFLLIFPNFYANTFKVWFTSPATSVAMFHTFFNVTCTIIFLPISNIFIYLVKKIIPDSEEEKVTVTTYLDDRLIDNPMLAFVLINKENMTLLQEAITNYSRSFESFIREDTSSIDFIEEEIDRINNHEKQIVDYIVKVASHISTKKEVKVITNLHENLGDIMRISEISDNFTKYTNKEVNNNLTFSDKVKEELRKMHNYTLEMSELTKKVLLDGNKNALIEIDKIEEKIDEMRSNMLNDHIARLNSGECKADSSSVFINLVSNIERLADHITYVAHSSRD